MANNKFWGTVSGVAMTPVAIAAGIAKGAIDAASGNGGFAEGVEKTTGSLIKSAEQFGEEHGDLITKGIIGGAAAALGRRLISGRRLLF